RRSSGRVFLLYVRALLFEFRYTLLALAAAVAVGAAVVANSADAKFDGRPASLPLACYTAWMSLLAQPTLNPPPTTALMVMFALYPLLGAGLIGEGVIRLGFLMISRRRGEKEWTKVAASTYRDHVILCGLGHLGVRVLEQYVKAGVGVVVIERDGANPFVARARGWDVPVLQRDMTEDQSLVDAGIAHARAIVIATNNDVTNLEVSLDAKRMNPRVRVLMRVFDQQLAEKLTGLLGVDQAFSSSALAAPIVAGMSMGVTVLSTAVIAGRPHVVAQLAATAGLAGKSVADVEREQGCRILGLAVDGADAESPPAPLAVVRDGAAVTVHVAADRLSAVAAAAAATR
ncbi:MAG TPA: NAD(P)-binding protein, partial [Humisphaera sp.]